MTVITVATVQLLVLLPALAALAGLLLRRARAVSGLVAVGAAALAFVLSVFQFSETAGRSEVIPTFGPLAGGRAADPPEPPRRPHLGGHRRRGGYRRAGRPGVLDLVPARRPALPRLRDDRLAVPRRHAARRPVERPRAHAGRLGGDGLVLLPAHRPHQRARVGAAGRIQGVHGHPRRGHRVRPRAGDPRRRRGQHRDRNRHRRTGPAARGRPRPRSSPAAPSSPPPWSCSSPGWPASRASSRSTTGSPTPWRARRRPPPSSTRRRWWPPAPTSSPGSTRCMPSTTPLASSSACSPG